MIIIFLRTSSSSPSFAHYSKQIHYSLVFNSLWKTVQNTIFEPLRWPSDNTNTTSSPSPSLSSTMVVFYFHSKKGGVSTKHDPHCPNTTDHRPKCGRISRVLYWRKNLWNILPSNVPNCISMPDCHHHHRPTTTVPFSNNNNNKNKCCHHRWMKWWRKVPAKVIFQAASGKAELFGKFLGYHVRILVQLDAHEFIGSHPIFIMWKQKCGFLVSGINRIHLWNLWQRHKSNTGVGLYRHTFWIPPHEYRFPDDNVSTNCTEIGPRV